MGFILKFDINFYRVLRFRFCTEKCRVESKMAIFSVIRTNRTYEHVDWEIKIIDFGGGKRAGGRETESYEVI